MDWLFCLACIMLQKGRTHKENTSVISSTFCYRFCFPFLLFLLVAFFSPSVYADGGAPQLAYVAGAAPGISFIDIARRRVTGRISLAGNPHLFLLRLAGPPLYVSHPTPSCVLVF